MTGEQDDLAKDQKQLVNGPTTFTRGLTDKMYMLLVTDPYALISIGGGVRQAIIFDTGASLGITFDKDEFDGPLTIPE